MMISLIPSKLISTSSTLSPPPPPPPQPPLFLNRCPNSVLKFDSFRGGRKRVSSFCLKAQSGDVEATTTEWIKKLPDKNKALYSHSLPCIEAWLKQLGFHQSKDDRAVWFIEKAEWHAQLSLDVTDLHIRYLKSGPGDLDKDVDRRFSYALSREDIENAILGGP